MSDVDKGSIIGNSVERRVGCKPSLDDALRARGFAAY